MNNIITPDVTPDAEQLINAALATDRLETKIVNALTYVGPLRQVAAALVERGETTFARIDVKVVTPSGHEVGVVIEPRPKRESTPRNSQ